MRIESCPFSRSIHKRTVAFWVPGYKCKILEYQLACRRSMLAFPLGNRPADRAVHIRVVIVNDLRVEDVLKPDCAARLNRAFTSHPVSGFVVG